MTFPGDIINSPNPEYFYSPVIALFIGNTLLYLFCQSPLGKRDNSWIDVMWSISFCIPNAVVLAMRSLKSDGINSRMILASACVLFWALRLSIYIWVRHKSEDYRYK